MKEIAREGRQGGKNQVVHIEQEYGAGFHNNAEYQKFKDEVFKEENWLRRMQSA